MIKILFWALVVLTIPTMWFYHRMFGNQVAQIIGNEQAFWAGPILITIIAWSLLLLMDLYFRCPAEGPCCKMRVASAGYTETFIFPSDRNFDGRNAGAIPHGTKGYDLVKRARGSIPLQNIYALKWPLSGDGPGHLERMGLARMGDSDRTTAFGHEFGLAAAHG